LADAVNICDTLTIAFPEKGGDFKKDRYDIRTGDPRVLFKDALDALVGSVYVKRVYQKCESVKTLLALIDRKHVVHAYFGSSCTELK
jgi:hypothetical protein